jgi:hypothetical protein
MEEADTEDRMRARVRASGWSLPLAGASATCYSLYGKSPSRDVDDRQNISSTSRASPAVFSPHWWPVCLGQVCEVRGLLIIGRSPGGQAEDVFLTGAGYH